MKEIHLHIYRTGRIKRYGYYSDLRSAACASALLSEWGWDTKPIKELKLVGKYYVYAEATNHKPYVGSATTVTSGYKYLSSLKKLGKSKLIKRK